MKPGSILVDIGQYYTKAGVKIEFVPVKVFRTYHHLIFEPFEDDADYSGYKCGRDRILSNLDDEQALNVVHDYLEYLFHEYAASDQSAADIA